MTDDVAIRREEEARIVAIVSIATGFNVSVWTWSGTSSAGEAVWFGILTAIVVWVFINYAPRSL